MSGAVGLHGRSDVILGGLPCGVLVAVHDGPADLPVLGDHGLGPVAVRQFAIGAEGVDVPAGRALDLVLGYAAGIDLTRRDRQRDCRERQVSWEAGKSFDASAPCGPITLQENAGDIAAASLQLTVNGEVRQHTRIALMIWNIAETIAHLSGDYRLVPGDLIFTGTPSGVGAVVPGDVMRVDIDGLESLSITIIESGSHEAH